MAIRIVDFDRRLIELVEKSPILWDSRTDCYKLSERKPNVWQDIAAEVKASPIDYLSKPDQSDVVINASLKAEPVEFQLSAGLAKSRWNDMRTQYRKYLIKSNKWKQQSPNESGLKKSQAPKKYKYTDELQFLYDVLNFEHFEDNSLDRSGEDGNSVEVDADPEDSISSAEETTAICKSSSKKRKMCGDVSKCKKSLDKLTKDYSDNLQDDDWLFARRVYLKLKEIPNGHNKELLKQNIEKDVCEMVYGGQATSINQIIIPASFHLSNEYTATE